MQCFCRFESQVPTTEMLRGTACLELVRPKSQGGLVENPQKDWHSGPKLRLHLRFWAKDRRCALTEPSGACPEGIEEPTGEIDCTYTYKKVGEISIDELEGELGMN